MFAFRHIAIILLLSIATQGISQKTKIIGTITDDLTEESMPFVNVYFQGTKVGVMSDQDGKFVLDVKIFDAEIYSGTKFGGNSGATLDGVQISISLFNEDSQLIHTYDAFTENGLVRYDVMAKETSQDGTLWLINNLYTIKIIATLDNQSIEKNYEFYGQASAYSYNAGSAIRPPTGLTATAGNDQVTLSWNAPAGVKGITDYKIEYSKDGLTWDSFSHIASDVVTDGSETDVVDGLADSTLYHFRVAAINYSGDGKYSSIVSATTN